MLGFHIFFNRFVFVFIIYRFRFSKESHWIISGGFFVALKINERNIKKLFLFKYKSYICLSNNLLFAQQKPLK